MPSSSYFFNAISFTKDMKQFTDGEIEADYKPFIINRMVSGYRNLVLFAEEMNVHHNISKKDHLFLYMNMIPKKKRRTLWANKIKNEDIALIMEYYNISYEKAECYMRILTPEQVDHIKHRINTGGVE